MIPILEKRPSQDFSGSDEDEVITIIEARRAPTSPPRKKRRLSNGQQQISHSPSTDDTEGLSDSNEEKSSDKENNNHNIKIRKNKRKRKFAALTQKPSSNNNRSLVYRFGKMRLSTPIDTAPGAIVRLELINFLCHSNFTIAFHPCVNIIYGQNGSGKSAIEAGISMALGINAKKTGRGKNIKDVIKFGCDFSIIKLYLHNQGSEALTDQDYGDEICIERKLTTSGKNGTSSFRVLNSRLKKVGAGVKAVRQIVDKLNINVDNPCVVLKQSTAKEFLNSTKTSDKFKFFMQASKLQDYETSLNEAKANVYEAKEQQKQTKGAFSQIKERYFECKRQFDALLHANREEEMIKQWKIAEKWMKYHQEHAKLDGLDVKCKDIQNKVIKGKEQLKRLQEQLTGEIEMGQKMKAQYEEKQTAAEKYVTPINEVKKTMTKYETERKNLHRSASSKQKYVDQSRRKIKNYQKEYQQLMRSLENNERGRKLAALQQKINTASEKMHQYRNQRDPLRNKIEPTIEMKENEARLNARRTELNNKMGEVKQFKTQLSQIRRGQNNRSELFRDPSLHRKNISIQQIKAEITRHQRKFRVKPIGPLGEFIEMVPYEDQQILTKHIQIVQAVLGQALFQFLVDSTVDQQLFKSIMRKRFGITVPTIQFKYDTNMFQIDHNQFANYRPRDSDGPLIRVTDMFTIKDNNPWIYNAIIVHSAPERVYAHGTLNVARQFLQSLDQSKLKFVSNIMTYQEKQLYTVKLRGRTVQGNAVRMTQPILQSDKTKYKLWVEQQVQRAFNEQQEIEKSIYDLQQFVRQGQQNLQSYQRQFNQLNGNIKKLEQQLERYTREQREMEEDENDDDELQQQMQEIQNSIEDEKSQIQGLEEEIAPFKQRGDELLDLLAQKKTELVTIERKMTDEQSSIAMLKEKFQKFCDKIRRTQQAIKKVPAIIQQYEQQLQREKEDYDKEDKRIKGLLGEAKRCGNEVTKENYPKNAKNRNRPFKLIELQRERGRREAALEEWRNANNDSEEIKERFNAIKPLYETHQDRVDKCNMHVDEMTRLLQHRRKEWNKMKDFVKYSLNQEFRYIMRKQGHDGELVVDYKDKELNMKVRMASHDGATQVVNSKTLSGGERSFTQVALIMALQKFSGSPMCIYDEFDVFMDSVNRGNSIKILLKTALNEDEKQKPTPPERQYIFITPNDVSPVIAGGHNKNLVHIHKLNPPRK